MFLFSFIFPLTWKRFFRVNVFVNKFRSCVSCTGSISLHVQSQLPLSRLSIRSKTYSKVQIIVSLKLELLLLNVLTDTLFFSEYIRRFFVL